MPSKLFPCLLCIFVLVTSGCRDVRESLGLHSDEEKFEVPADESTPEERQYLESVLTRIEALAAELGHSSKFNTLPMIVTTEDPMSLNREGYCHYDYNGDPAFIAINRSVLESDKPPIRASKTFGVLLHEIGHCYFNREHDSAVLRKPGFYLVHDEVDDEGGNRWNFEVFSVSIMRDDFHGGTIDLGAFVPRSAEKYYVAEILGLQRLQSIEELQALLGIRLVEINPSTPLETNP